MRRYIAIIWAGLGVACVSAVRAENVDYVRAIVGDSVITGQEIERAAGPPSSSMTDAAYRANWEETFKALVRDEVVLQEFKRLEKDKGAKIPEDAIDNAVQSRIRDNPRFRGDRAEFDKALESEGLTREKYREKIRNEIIIGEMYREFVKDPIISPHQVETYYLEHQAEFKVPERVKFRWIVEDKHDDDTNNLTRKKMEDVLIAVKGASDFAEVAKTYSEHAQRDSDWLEVDAITEPSRSELAKLKPGEYTGVIETADSYRILRLDERDPAHVPALSELRDQIRDQMRKNEINRRREAWINRLRGRILVEYK